MLKNKLPIVIFKNKFLYNYIYRLTITFFTISIVGLIKIVYNNWHSIDNTIKFIQYTFQGISHKNIFVIIFPISIAISYLVSILLFLIISEFKNIKLEFKYNIEQKMYNFKIIYTILITLIMIILIIIAMIIFKIPYNNFETYLYLSCVLFLIISNIIFLEIKTYKLMVRICQFIIFYLSIYFGQKINHYYVTYSIVLCLFSLFILFITKQIVQNKSQNIPMYKINIYLYNFIRKYKIFIVSFVFYLVVTIFSFNPIYQWFKHINNKNILSHLNYETVKMTFIGLVILLNMIYWHSSTLKSQFTIIYDKTANYELFNIINISINIPILIIILNNLNSLEYIEFATSIAAISFIVLLVGLCKIWLNLKGFVFAISSMFLLAFVSTSIVDKVISVINIHILSNCIITFIIFNITVNLIYLIMKGKHANKKNY